MRWLELTVEVDSEAVEAVSEILGRLGHGAAVRPTRLLHDPADELAVREDPSSPYELTAHLPDDAAAPAAIEQTERALWHLQAFGLRPVGALRVRPVEDRDWTEAWKADYQPQRIGRLVIVPSWLEAPGEPDAVLVRLDPGMAFGTGLHPTTRACLALLQAVEPMPARVLDVGSGSGILGIAALALGAEAVDAVDTDPEAVAATVANAAGNGMGGRVTARPGTLDAAPAEPYPLVLANLVAAVLIQLASRLAAHLAPGGTLLASGIIDPRGDEVREVLEAAGLRCAE
ncbi:MAG TPA: 50S ribosomal protein L11 methyltransferase, partial [Candidatus Limnocylindria bacterium]|nr:50S ribosomal protein L11 methyltransferase [Candidatus Limnocylindria bacterium]